MGPKNSVVLRKKKKQKHSLLRKMKYWLVGNTTEISNKLPEMIMEVSSKSHW